MRSNPDIPSAPILRDIMRLARGLTSHFEKRTSLSYARLRMLSRLKRRGPQNQRALQEHLGIDAAAVSRQVSLLIEAGLAQRTQDSRDERCWLVSLTPAGDTAARELMELRRRIEGELLSSLTHHELEVLQGAFAKISERLSNLELSPEVPQ